jgi:hypothetical protein
LRDEHRDEARLFVLSFPQAGIQNSATQGWMPAFAGMTRDRFGAEEGAPKKARNEKAVKPLKTSNPAKCVIQCSQ